MKVAELMARLAQFDGDALVQTADKQSRGNLLSYPIESRMDIREVVCNGVHNGKHTHIVIVTQDTWSNRHT